MAAVPPGALTAASPARSRPHGWARYVFAYAALALMLIPINLAVAGHLYPDGQLDQVAGAVVMAFVFLSMVGLYAWNPLYGFFFAALIATTNLFSLLPTWVYKIEGVGRLDDLALLVTLGVALPRRVALAVRGARRSTGLIVLLLAVVAFELLYTVLVVGELPWLVLREARTYVHFLWYFLPFAFIENPRDVAKLMQLVLVGTACNAVLYATQVVGHINLGYVDTGFFESSSGAVGWRVWQGSPDLLLFAIVGFFWLAIRGPGLRLSYWIAAFIVTLALFLTNTRSVIATYSVGVLLAAFLYARADRVGVFRTIAYAALLAGVLAGGVLLASRLLHVDVLTARYDLTKTDTAVLTRDANLLARLLMLANVAAKIAATNPWLGLGFISANSAAAQHAGIEYFEVFQIRNNDIGVATILGQGGWVLAVTLLIVLAALCLRLFRLNRMVPQPEFRIYTVSLIAFIMSQLPLSVAGFGLTSPQVAATLTIGVAMIELACHFYRARAGPGRPGSPGASTPPLSPS